MAIFDIFSTSFLFSIAIILLISGILFTYFNYKIDKQNHKLTSMVNLVSVLAEDLQFVKNQLNKNIDNNLQYSSQIQMINKMNSELISVSDVENDDDENEDDDENDDDDENEDDDDLEDENDADEDDDRHAVADAPRGDELPEPHDDHGAGDQAGDDERRPPPVEVRKGVVLTEQGDIPERLDE